MVLHHDLFGDDAHIQQIAVKHLFAVTETGVEPGMCIGIAHERDIITKLQHCISIGTGENTVTADTLNVTTCLTIDTQLAQVFAAAPRHQFRAHAIGADHRQEDFTLAVGIQTAFPRNLLRTGRQILMLQTGQVACAENQTDQADQIGHSVTEAQLILHQSKLLWIADALPQGITCADQHRR